MAVKVAILGSTGSIGTNALRVIEALNKTPDYRLQTPDYRLQTTDSRCKTQDARLKTPAGNESRVTSDGTQFTVVALTAHRNVELLAEQVRRFRPRYAAVTNEDYYQELCDSLKGVDVEVLSGAEALVRIVELADVDIVLSAVVGVAGLAAVLAAARAGKRLAIANKEPLVVAGEMLMREAAAHKAEILPIDSEHSAVFQAMRCGRREEVSRIVLTTSGGPFRKFGAEELARVTIEQALAHPVWDMGSKITVDSATMMNKALEVIEARWLFDIPLERIEVLVHPESIVHSMVEFVDGSVIAQLGLPDMRLPIQYALTYPRRLPGEVKPVKLDEVGRLTFEKPDGPIFRAVELGYEVARTGGTAAAVFNAANEAAVGFFLAGLIKFVNIVELVEHCLDKHNVIARPGLERIVEADAWARAVVAEKIGQRCVNS